MKRPLNLAIIKYFTTVKEGCAEDVMNSLESEYGSYRAFNRHCIEDAIKTAKENGLLSETKVGRYSDESLCVYYNADENQRRVINGYIKD